MLQTVIGLRGRTVSNKVKVSEHENPLSNQRNATRYRMLEKAAAGGPRFYHNRLRLHALQEDDWSEPRLRWPRSNCGPWRVPQPEEAA